ncbi:MAG: AMP-binding protein, partial [Planctomycetota bacterium]|jgi:acyl-[acyl-carrier-protein]-phospholipid O-acyltransferase/long-chain-fatty-acid--[acyl-carrier-protein] ligase
LTVATVIILPDFLLRLIAFLLTRLLYRIRIKGLENVPAEGGALLICNHVSWVDGLLLNATQQRHIRFLVYRDYYNKWPLRWLFKLGKYVPISAEDSPKQLIRAFRKARAALDAGELVCVFAEGAMTRTGVMLGFRGGFERIVKDSDYPIIPIYLGGVWGSIFSYYYGKPLSTLPKKFPYPVTINFGEPMPTDTTAEQIRQQVAELSCEHYETLRRTRKSLADDFIRVARKNRRRRCISDSSGKELNYSKTLVSSIALADKIAKLTQQQDNVGILLPPSAGGVLTNLAVTLLGKVTVNLNYVASKEAREVAVQQCKLKTVISSRKFIEKLDNLADTGNLVFLEDIVETIDKKAKLKAYLKARFMPRRFLARTRNFSADDPVTIIYTSGSSGKPKGVMLSHNNIASNIEAARMVFRIQHNDDVCAVLPLFHSFGYTATFWLPLLSGVSAVYVPNPLDGETVGKCVRRNKSTLLFGTPTFLLNYVRKAKPDDFATLRFVVVGAEKLKPSVADKFEKKFGIRPVEGYGATELSPVVSINLPDLESVSSNQMVSRPGTVGKPIPGVTVKIVDIDSGQPLDVDQEGLVMVKGPNVMLGYLDMPEESAAVLKDGWYNTGDVGKLDADGFLSLTDRLSRFSKIGGEMVPHQVVEQAYMEGLNTAEQVVAVTGVPDEKKGERLVVLYLEQAGTAEKLHEIISACNVPNMWKPRRDNYVKIDSMPILGSGKLDIMQLRKTAMDAKSKN